MIKTATPEQINKLKEDITNISTLNNDQKRSLFMAIDMQLAVQKGDE